MLQDKLKKKMTTKMKEMFKNEENARQLIEVVKDELEYVKMGSGRGKHQDRHWVWYLCNATAAFLSME